MAIFLTNYFEESKSDFINKMIQLFLDYEYDKPRNYPYWHSWTRAAYDVNHEQQIMCCYTIYINTPISQKTALKIIEIWFNEYEALLDLHAAQAILADTSLCQQAIESAKQKLRSYLLLDDEVTVLETYQIMMKLLELSNQKIDAFEVDQQQDNKPKDFVVLLNWIRICEQVIIKK